MISSFILCYLASWLPIVHNELYPKTDNLNLFVKFDNFSHLTNVISGTEPNAVKDAIIAENINGPFGEPLSSYTVESNWWMCEYSPLPPFQSFTFAFFFYSPANESNGAIFQATWRDGLSVSYNKMDLEIRAIDQSSWPPRTKAKASIPDFFEPYSWNFVGLSYKHEQKLLKVYNRIGSVVGYFQPFPFSNETTEDLDIGLVSFDGDTYYMRPDDAIACLFFYNTSLTGSEIAKLPYACQGVEWQEDKPNNRATTDSDFPLSHVITLLFLSVFFG